MMAEWAKGSVESMAYKDLYNFHKAFGVGEHNDAYWENMVDAAGKINERYKDTKMAGIVAHHLVGFMVMLDKEAQNEEG